MKTLNNLKIGLLLPLFIIASTLGATFSATFVGSPVYAEGVDNEACPDGETLDPDTEECVAEETAATGTCAVDGIGWMVCPVMTFLAKLNDAAFGFLNNFLEVPARITTDTAVRNAWEIFRNIANIAFVIAFLFVIYSQITGMGITNYGIKKLLPKIILVAILVNVSLYICQILVDLSNIFGSSLYQLFKDIPVSGGGEGGWASDAWATAGAVVLGAGAIVGLIALIIFAPTALLAFALIIIILIARQAFVVLLLLMSPLAFVAYLLPNTEKWFKKWWQAFTSLLMVFPIIALVFGASTFAAQILLEVSQDGAGGGDDEQMMKIVAAGMMAVPLFAVPVLLKGSMSAAGTIGTKLAGLQDRVNRNTSNGLKNSGLRKDLGNRMKIAANNPDSKWGQRLGGAYRYRNKINNLRGLREGEVKRGVESSFAGALGEKDADGNYTAAALKLQQAAAGGAGQGAQVRAAAAATRKLHGQFDEDVTAFKATMTSASDTDLLHRQMDSSLSEEERSAASGMLMTRSRAVQNQAIRNAVQLAGSGDEHAESIQKQMTADMGSRVPLGLGAGAMAEMKRGKLGANATTPEEAASKPPGTDSSYNFDSQLAYRASNKLAPNSIPDLDPDDLAEISNAVSSGRIQGDDLKRLKANIGTAYDDPRINTRIKDDARPSLDAIVNSGRVQNVTQAHEEALVQNQLYGMNNHNNPNPPRQNPPSPPPPPNP